MKNELDSADKELLKDIDAFSQHYAAAGWHIRDKAVKEDLSRVRLFRSSMTSVQMVLISLKSAMLTDTQFTGVEFHQCVFAEAMLKGVTFTNCKFFDCSFERASLVDCRFVTSVSKDIYARAATFEGCVFESFEDTSGVYAFAALTKCRFERSRFDNGSFHGAKLNATAFKESALKNTVFTKIEGAGLLFEDSFLHNCGFESSVYGAMRFLRGSSKGVTFNKFDTEKPSFQACTRIEALLIRACVWTGAAIEACNEVSELTIDNCKMPGLTINTCQLAYFEILGTELSGESAITGCRIAGWRLEKSTLTGTKIASCAIAGYLNTDGAVFDGAVVTGIAYASDLKLSAAGVKYLNGSGELGRR